MEDTIADEILTDLLRSAWIVESARAGVLAEWGAGNGASAGRVTRARDRAELVAQELAARSRTPDEAIVEPHAAWMRSLLGGPGEGFGELFLIRLGDWVENHAGPFLEPSRFERMKEMGELDRSTVSWPESLPAPPPFEPVETVPVEPPGEVLFRFGILADLHFGSARGETMARAAIADLNSSGAELVIQLGDITDKGRRSEFETAQRVLGDLQMPFATMMGNHDVFSVEEQRLAGREYYPSFFGREPDGVLLEHKGWRFAVLDSTEHGASPFAPFDLVTGTFTEGPGGAIVRGSLTPPQHEILAEVAAPGAPPAFVFLHHPPQPFTAFPPVLFGLRDADSGRLHATCDSGNVWGVFAGHTHRNARPRTYDGVPVQEVAIPRDYPFGYALVDVTEQGYAYRFVQISDRALLEEMYPTAGAIIRRYALGDELSRGFVWSR